MAKSSNQSPKPTQKTAVANAIGSSTPKTVSQTGVQLSQTVYHGPIPDPNTLSGFEKIVPGAAARLINLAEEESIHRRNQENLALSANIEAQRKTVQNAEYQTKIVYRTDVAGQALGFLTSMACVAGAIFLAVKGRDMVAMTLAAIPTGALIRSYFFERKGQK
jgi:uncharacterized membrane protein